MDSTTMKGTVQGYFDEMADKELENPLANTHAGYRARRDILTLPYPEKEKP